VVDIRVPKWLSALLMDIGVSAYADDPGKNVLVIFRDSSAITPIQITMPVTAWKDEMPETVIDMLRRRMPRELLVELLRGNRQSEMDHELANA
jgi:hypothetical protein